MSRAPRRIAIIGHRGVGKSAFLKRAETYLPGNVLYLDLDLEIERRHGKTVSEIFLSESESGFRKIEREIFSQIDRETVHKDVFLALGGGFNPEAIPSSWQVWWLRRPSDKTGRIFFNRPQLNPELSSLEEFFKRAREREPAFEKRADQTLWLDEGLDLPESAERSFVRNEVQDLGGIVTFLPEQLGARKRWVTWLESRVNFGVKFIELRDDLLQPAEIKEILKVLPHERALVSFRAKENVTRTIKALEGCLVQMDWPVEFGDCPLANPDILSFHLRKPGQTLDDALGVFPEVVAKGTQLKAALPVYTFKELLAGETWRLRDPLTRSFLPMSDDGRWIWYRQLKAKEQNIGFFRDSASGSSLDQPTLLQWARARKCKAFAAILGSPVSHSRTPMMQQEFFKKRNASVFAIQLNEVEWSEGFKILEHLGLRWAAVTAPLKALAFQSSQHATAVCADLKTANTLLLDNGGWRAHNTDLDGFHALIEEASSLQGVLEGGLGGGRGGGLEPVAVWGGGGTLAVVRKVLPNARFYSARSGRPRENEASAIHPKAVVWAVGRSHPSTSPPETWKPEIVIDLHYNEDSPGRDYAKASGSRYVSGLKMFSEQAKAQQRFWNGEIQ